VDRQTRDKFTILTSEDVTTGNACLETPPALYQKIVTDFGPFHLDLTADPQRHLCPLWLGPSSPLHTDALIAPWHELGAAGYSNPPYGPFVARILKKAKQEAKVGFTSTFLLPVRMTRAFHAHVLCGASELWFCDKRITFWENGAPKLTLTKDGSYKVTSALFDSMIVRFLPGQRFSPPRAGSWKVPPHV